MAGYLSRLVVLLQANIAEYASDMGKAAHLAEKTSRDISRALGQVRNVVAAIGVGAIVKEFHDLASEAIKTAASLDDFAERTGSSVEELSALKNVADVSGESFETVVSAIDKFAKGLSGLEDETKGAGLALSQLGIEAKEGGQFKDSAALMREVAGALDKYQDGLEKTQVIQALFGKGSAKLNSYLKDLANSGDDVVTTTTAQASAAEEYEKQVKRTGLAFDAFIRSMVMDALPAMGKIRDLFGEIAGEADRSNWGKFLSETFVSTLQWTVKALAGIQALFVSIGRSLGGLAAAGTSIAQGQFKVAGEILDKLRADGEKHMQEVAAFMDRVDKIGTKTGPSGQMFSDAGFDASRNKPKLAGIAAGTGGTDKATKAISEFAKQTASAGKLLQELRADLATVGMDDFAKETAKVNAKIDEFTALSTTKRESLKAEALAIRTNTMEIEGAIAMENEWLKAKAESARADTAFIEGLIEKGEHINQATVDLGKLSSMFEEGKISADQYAAAFRGIVPEGYMEEVQQEADEVSTIWQEAAKDIQNAMGDFLVDAMEGNWKDIGSGFTKMLNRMVAEAIAADLMKRLVGNDFASGKSGSNVGGLVGAALSYFGGARAGGGSVSPGMSYLVGEGGAEIFQPSVAGNIVPASAPTGQTVYQSFILNQPASRETQQQVAASAQAGLMRAARRNN